MSCDRTEKPVCDPNVCFAHFWMVLNDSNSFLCGHGPTFRHMDRPSAEREAARLATKNHGVKFIVLEAVAACRKSDVEWLKAADQRDLPPF